MKSIKGSQMAISKQIKRNDVCVFWENDCKKILMTKI